MNFVLDESMPVRVAERLRAEGHNVVAVQEVSPGIVDDEVLELARSSTAVLVTADKDFGELVFRLGRAHAGVLLVRLAGSSADEKAEAVSAVVANHGGESRCGANPKVRGCRVLSERDLLPDLSVGILSSWRGSSSPSVTH